MNNTRTTLTALYVICGIVLGGLLATGLGSLVIKLSCGSGGQPNSFIAGLQWAIGGNTAGYAIPAGCTPSTAVIRIVDITASAALITFGALVLSWWLHYRQSDRHFIHDLRTRDGFAKGGEIRQYVSAHAVTAKTRTLRPSAATPSPELVGWKVGRAHGRDVYVSIEDSVVVEGAPRSGKGYRFIINAILDWTGPLITTSTRNDNLSATMAARTGRGEVTVFDPQQLSGVRSTLRISPITGCEDPLVADQRGQAIVAGTALGTSAKNQEWAQVASSVLSRLLHAAAVSGRNVDALARWGSNPRLALEAVNVLTEDGTPGWAEDLDAIINGDERLLASSWFGVSGAVRPLAIPAIRDAMTPGPGDTFDPDTFLAGENTLYLIGTGAGAGSVGGFLGAVLDDIVETARRKALASTGSRLDPPLALILDEIANMFSWPALPRIMADGGGVGISTVVVLQALSQAETAWSKAEADTIWSAATAKLLLGGASDVGHLRDVESLLGTRRIHARAHSYSDSNTTTSISREKVPVLTLDEIRRMPQTIGLLAYRNRRGVLLELEGWTERSDANTISSGKTATELEQQQVFAQQYELARQRRAAAGERR
ncbi:type IV secretory system conjugative DNA transfer family protein [Planctomonas sp. JC2975]|uniref:type IV secretory system conjugative DNA transfer family protein n=1 Tax=Planctomonas sp. JC2975 TaxID=2729626 RepID=UPI0014731631|nr:TraM recognition domain-containing protein [Planctomonas sp. JC2975]NNC12841.1 type IV secretory system conjugative DNA transfer family protein [Planctomonas sp. JC2975]